MFVLLISWLPLERCKALISTNSSVEVKLASLCVILGVSMDVLVYVRLHQLRSSVHKSSSVFSVNRRRLVLSRLSDFAFVWEVHLLSLRHSTCSLNNSWVTLGSNSSMTSRREYVLLIDYSCWLISSREATSLGKSNYISLLFNQERLWELSVFIKGFLIAFLSLLNILTVSGCRVIRCEVSSSDWWSNPSIRNQVRPLVIWIAITMALFSPFHICIVLSGDCSSITKLNRRPCH
jgi:hypothetical protein